MKKKYLPLIRNMSHVELKKFNKADYKKKVIRDILKMLPSYKTTDVDGYAQCVSNALQHEVNLLLKKRVRTQSLSDATEPSALSETLLEALDLTMHADSIDASHELSPQVILVADGENGDEGVNDDDDDDDNDDECDEKQNDNAKQSNCENESPSSDRVNPLDDSITHLKQTVNSKSQNETHAVQTAENNTGTNDQLKGKNHKCCDSCSIKPKAKKKYGMIQCNVCMSWFHEQCVGLNKSSEPIGLWLCLSCRKFPETVTTELSVLKTELCGLKKSTHDILSAVTELTTNIEQSIGNINDRITALNKQISANDKRLNESLQTLTETTNNIKINVDQKSCQILNKTSAVLDKVKSTQTELSKQNTSTGTRKNESDYVLVDAIQNTTEPNADHPRSGKRTNGSANAQTKHKQKDHTNMNQNKQQKKKQVPNQTNRKQSDDIETVDLTRATETTTQTKTIRHATLLTGDSILKM